MKPSDRTRRLGNQLRARACLILATLPRGVAAPVTVEESDRDHAVTISVASRNGTGAEPPRGRPYSSAGLLILKAVRDAAHARRRAPYIKDIAAAMGVPYDAGIKALVNEYVDRGILRAADDGGYEEARPENRPNA